MTIQASDYFYLKDKKYTLIDIEKDKQLVDFIKTSLFSKIKRFFNPPGVCSGCWRGYTATYYVKDNKLYGTKYEAYPYPTRKVKLSSKQVPINYTGSCIIAIGGDKKWLISDFLDCYLYYDEAYELHFTNGKLDEMISLIPAINEFRELEQTEEFKNDKIDRVKRHKLISSIARKYLKYQYGKRSYKWRGSGHDDFEDEH